MPEIDYEKLEVRKVCDVDRGTKVKLPGDPAGRVFTVGYEDRYGMISLHRGPHDRIEVSAIPTHPVVIQP